MDRNCSVLADSRWEILLKAIGQLLGNAQRLLDSLWAIHRECWNAAGLIGIQSSVILCICILYVINILIVMLF